MSVSQLKSAIERLANVFAEDLLRALSAASFSELSAELHAGQGRGRAVRASAKSAAPAPRAASPAAAPRAKAGRGGKGRGRRTAADMGKTIDSIVATLKTAGAAGLRSEELRRRVGLARAEMMRPVAMALSTKRIRKTGEKRATTYFAR